MEFIVQYNMMNEDQQVTVKDAVKDIPHRFVGVLPFSHEITSNEPLVGTDFIPYGSTLFTTLAMELKWKGLSFDLNTFNYEAAIANRRDMLNDEYVLSVKDAISFMKAQSQVSQWFIRPSKDLKQFSGQVIDAWECAEWLADAVQCASSGTYQLDEQETVVVATPQKILAEWRWFIVSGQVIDGAMYRAHGQLVKKHETDPMVIYEAQEFANGWLPGANCVMDLALTDTGVKVIEFNCINSSGFYGHDVDKIFKSLYNFHK